MFNKITYRILASYLVPLGFLLLLGGIEIFAARKAFKLEQEIKLIEKERIENEQLAYQLTNMIASIRGYILFPKATRYLNTYQEAYQNYQEKAETELEHFEDSPMSQLVHKLVDKGEQINNAAKIIFQLVDRGNIELATQQVEQLQLATINRQREELLQALEIQLKERIQELEETEIFLQQVIFVGTAMTILVTLVVGLVIALPLKRQLPRVVDAAESIAAGDLTANLNGYQDRTEIGQLLQAFNSMNHSLNKLIFQAQKSGTQISTSTSQIAASGKELEATVSEQVASINQVNATSHEIAATTGELLKTIKQINQMVEQTAITAGKSQASLNSMQQAMEQMAQATAMIAAKLGIMDEKANNISSVVNTITKVADQTNLLSLNAAIEAEKAGEYGAGFAVVAREIRRLADQTAIATLEIEQTVKEMQSSVSTGVMEVDKFSKEVNRYVGEVGNISSDLTQVIEDVQVLTPQFEAVSQSMDQQYQGTQQISMAIAQLSEASAQTIESLQETNAALGQLDDAAQGLREEISQFKLQQVS